MTQRLGVTAATFAFLCAISFGDASAAPRRAAAIEKPAKPSGLIAADAKVEMLKSGFKFLEGPACDREGNLYFSDPMDSKVHRLSTGGEFSLFREKTDMDNGQCFDAQGNLISCATTAHAVVSVAPDGKRTIVAGKYDGKPFNSPNDLWIDPKGGIYFTDPRYEMPGVDQGPIAQGGRHVFYISPDRKKVIRVVEDMVNPNGLVGSDDGALIYITDLGAGKTYVYSIQPDGALKDRKLFVPRGADGMTMDERGNVYLTGSGVFVYNPQGELIEVIEAPETPANVTFAGKDRKTLFMCARTSLYSLRMTVRGHKLAFETAKKGR